MRRSASTVHPALVDSGAAVEHRGQLGQTRCRAARAARREPGHGRRMTNRRCGCRPAPGTVAACSSVSPASSTSCFATTSAGTLSNRSTARITAGTSARAQAQEESLHQPPVVDLQAHRRQEVEGRQGLGHDARDLDVVVEGQVVAGDDVDVGLGELAIPAGLRALAAPDLLDLVAAERELEVAGVLEDEAGERHGEVEVQAKTRCRRLTLGISVQAAQDVDLFVDLALAQQLIQ